MASSRADLTLINAEFADLAGKQAAEFAEAQKRERQIGAPNFQEIAISWGGVDITRGYQDASSIAYPPEFLLKADTFGHDLYQRTLADPQIAAAWGQRQRMFLSRPWQIEPASDEPIDVRAADSIRNMLRCIPFYAISKFMHYGIFFGFSVGECLWAVRDNEIVIRDIKVRNRRRFRFRADGQPVMLTSDNPGGMLLEDQKFWQFKTGGDNSDEAYGVGIGNELHWIAHFKRYVDKYWLIHLEKYGSPTVLGSVPTQWTNKDASGNMDERVGLSLEALKSIQTDAAIVKPKDLEVDLLNSVRSGTTSYPEMIDEMNNRIAKVTLGQTLTLSSDGGQYKAEVHREILDGIIDGDDNVLSESFNSGPIAWLTAWNFSAAQPPRLTRQMVEDEDKNLLAERDSKLFNIGYRRTEESVKETYGDGYERKAEMPPGMFDSNTPPGQEPQNRGQNIRPGGNSAADDPDEGRDADQFAVGSNEFAHVGYRLFEDDTTIIKTRVKQLIDPQDLAEDGFEEDLHVTIAYGLINDDPMSVANLLIGRGTGELELIGLSVFGIPGADVLVATARSNKIDQLRQLITSSQEMASFDHQYRMHMTLAFLKPGTGAKYAATDLDFISDPEYGSPYFWINEVVHTTSNGRRTVIPLHSVNFAQFQETNLTINAREERAFEQALEQLDGGRFGDQGEMILRPLINRLARDGLDATRGDLQLLYADLDTTQFESLLTRFLFVADTWGRLTEDV